MLAGDTRYNNAGPLSVIRLTLLQDRRPFTLSQQTRECKLAKVRVTPLKVYITYSNFLGLRRVFYV